MPIPGYRAFRMAAALFADLFPDRANVIDGDDKDMVRIDQALQEACLYGEGAENDKEEVRPNGRWRVGSKIPINVYEGDRPVCQCHTAIDAARIVKAMNEV